MCINDFNTVNNFDNSYNPCNDDFIRIWNSWVYNGRTPDENDMSLFNVVADVPYKEVE